MAMNYRSLKNMNLFSKLKTTDKLITKLFKLINTYYINSHHTQKRQNCTYNKDIKRKSYTHSKKI